MVLQLFDCRWTKQQVIALVEQIAMNDCGLYGNTQLFVWIQQGRFDFAEKPQCRSMSGSRHDREATQVRLQHYKETSAFSGERAKRIISPLIYPPFRHRQHHGAFFSCPTWFGVWRRWWTVDGGRRHEILALEFGVRIATVVCGGTGNHSP